MLRSPASSLAALLLCVLARSAAGADGPDCAASTACIGGGLGLALGVGLARAPLDVRQTTWYANATNTTPACCVPRSPVPLYPTGGRLLLKTAGTEYGGWCPNACGRSDCRRPSAVAYRDYGNAYGLHQPSIVGIPLLATNSSTGPGSRSLGYVSSVINEMLDQAESRTGKPWRKVGFDWVRVAELHVHSSLLIPPDSLLPSPRCPLPH